MSCTFLITQNNQSRNLLKPQECLQMSQLSNAKYMWQHEEECIKWFNDDKKKSEINNLFLLSF